MDRLANLPRAGTPDAVSKFIEAYSETLQIPVRFIDFLVAHVEAGNPFSTTDDIMKAVGAVTIAAQSAGDVIRCKSAVDAALAGSLELSTERQYEVLQHCFKNMLGNFSSVE